MREVACDLCGSTDHLPLYDRTRDSPDVRNVVCRRCGLVFINPRPEPEEIRDTYTSGNFSVQARGSLTPSPVKVYHSEVSALARYRRLIDRGPRGVATGLALEIGCGIGSFLRLLRGAGWEVTGLEPDAGYAQFGSRRYGIAIEPKLFEAAAPGADALDLIASFHVIEHVVSPRSFLTQIAAALRPGGLLYLEHPCIERPYGGNLDLFFWSAHLTSLSAGTLGRLLRDVGLAVEAQGYDGDYLWTVARRAEPAPLAPADFPLDDPEEVRRRTHELHRRFLAWSAAGQTVRPSSRLARIGHLLHHEPWTLPARGGRKLARAADRFCRRLRGDDPAVPISARGGDPPAAALAEVLATRGWPTRIEAAPRPLADRRVLLSGDLIARAWQVWDSRQPTPWEAAFPVELTAPTAPSPVIMGAGLGDLPEAPRAAEIGDELRDRLGALLERAEFVGLRDRASASLVEDLYGPGLAAKVVLQPCPTSLIGHARPADRRGRSTGRPTLAFCPDLDPRRVDPSGLTYGALDTLAEALRAVAADGWAIRLAAHIPIDATLLPWLHRHGVAAETVDLCGADLDRLAAFYGGVDLVASMRGAPLRLAIGLGTPPLAITADDRLADWMRVTGRPNWVATPAAAAHALAARAAEVAADPASTAAEVRRSRTEAWQQAMTALDALDRPSRDDTPSTPPRAVGGRGA